MQALLVNPPYIATIYRGIKAAVQVQLPLGLASLAAELEQAGQQVAVLDANAEMLSEAETVERIVGADAELVGFTAATNLITTVQRLATAVRRRCPHKLLVVGGPHPSALPEATLEECAALDLAVVGEGEQTLLELCLRPRAAWREIPGLCLRDERGRPVRTPPRPPIADLDSLPLPARHLFPLERYQPGALLNTGVSGQQAATIITSRGCPSRCRYCASLAMWGAKVRFRSAEHIVSEVEQLVREQGVRQLAILDDTFFARRRRVERFCDLLIERGLRLRWWCYGRLDRRYDRELLRKLRRAGCYALNFGVESGDQAVLDRACKHIRLDRVEQNIRLAKAEGLFVFASFMVGLPGDTHETVRKTVRFAKALNPHVAQFCIATPFPGTELYREALASGWLQDVHGWDDIGLHVRSRYRNADLTAEEIVEHYERAQREFFFRPAYLGLLARRFVRHPGEIKGFALAGLYMVSEMLAQR